MDFNLQDRVVGLRPEPRLVDLETAIEALFLDLVDLIGLAQALFSAMGRSLPAESLISGLPSCFEGISLA